VAALLEKQSTVCAAFSLPVERPQEIRAGLKLLIQNEKKEMNKMSHWAGILASVFCVSFFIIVVPIIGWMQATANWTHIAADWCNFLATCAGSVCLVSTALCFFKKW
jgi:hypothetical protein